MAIARAALSQERIPGVITVIVLVLLAPLLMIDLFFVVEAGSGLAGRPMRRRQAPQGRTTIIVPAHNEAAGVRRALTDMCAAAGDQIDILLVADNCSDDTARIARDLPITVVERHDPLLRGKGYALAFAREHLRADPPATVVVLDADCRIDSASLAALVGASQQLQRPVQAVYLMEPSQASGAIVQLSSFAFLLKNLVRQRGLQRLAKSVHLTGTGMALPWRLFDGADLATAHIVEDIRLGMELARQGFHPQLIEESRVWSAHADQSSTLAQRSRWEGGFLSFAKATAPAMFGDALRLRSIRTLFASLDLLVPPLALLAMLNAAALLTAVLLAAVGLLFWLPALLIALVGALAGLVVMVAWWREGRDFLRPASLLSLPLYALWKLPMYLKLARSGAPKEWQRTERHDQTAD